MPKRRLSRLCRANSYAVGLLNCFEVNDYEITHRDTTRDREKRQDRPVVRQTLSARFELRDAVHNL
jgi:hypothetical protein